MGALTWLKILLPIVFDYSKEIFTPGADNEKTTNPERLGFLVIVSLFCMLVFVGERFFVLHGESIRQETNIVHLEATVAMQNIRINDLTLQLQQGVQVVEPMLPMPEPYDKRSEVPPAIMPDKGRQVSAQTTMMDWINGV